MVEYFYLCDRYAVRRPYRLERASRAVTFHGDIAQMVERLNGIQKVRGSIPLISTNTKTRNAIGRSGSFPSIPYRFADRTRCRVESVSTGGGVHFNDCGADRKTAARYAFGLWRGIPYRYLTAGRDGIIM